MAYIKNNDVSKTITKPILTLSKTGKNVIVFMLDRAINAYFPYFLEEKPELNAQYSGFVYYPNTLSYGASTINGAGPLFGGYEYTFEELNLRKNETYKEKRDEALKVLPYIFEKEGYDVTVCDPPLAGFKWVLDLSIFEDNKNIKTYITMGKIYNDTLIDKNATKRKLESNKRNFFFYSIMKVCPCLIEKLVYDEGRYWDSSYIEYNNSSWRALSVLSLLRELTSVTDDNINTYLSFDNDTAHNVCIYKLPDYEFSLGEIDNSNYKTAADGKIPMENYVQISHYHSNMATILQLGCYLDWMKQNDVYDNTRIIIASDHGWAVNQFDYMHLKNINIEWQNPLLLVKDFNAKGNVITDNSFMTNADVPTLATKDIITSPKNPFTGKLISSQRKLEGDIKLIQGGLDEDNPEQKVVEYKSILTVHDNIFNEENWNLIKIE